MTDHAELRAAVDAVKPGDGDTMLAYRLASGPTVIRALLAERDALRDAATQAIDALTQCTDALLHDGVPVDMEHPKRLAVVAADLARAALAQEQEQS